MMKRNSIAFWGSVALFLAIVLLSTQLVRNEYWFFAGYVILQFIVLAVAWSILGGYAGYVNFGTSAFFGVGVYTAVFLFKALGAPLLVQIAAADIRAEQFAPKRGFACRGCAYKPICPAYEESLGT